MSPYLALSAITDRVADLQAFCLQRQLQALRRVAQADPGTAAAIVTQASTLQQVHQAHGPATALALALSRVGLAISSSGEIKGPDNSCLHLLESTRHEVSKFVAVAWAYHVRGQVSHRCGLHDAPPP